MYVEPRQVVYRLQALQGPELQQVECAAQIYEERVVAGTSESLHAVLDVVDRLIRHLAVAFRVRRRADVVGSDLQVAGDHPALSISTALSFQNRHRVELLDVEVRVVQRGDGAGVVQEGVAVVDPRLEPELVGDVVHRVTVVVNVDLV